MTRQFFVTCSLSALLLAGTAHAAPVVDDLLDNSFDPFFNYDFDLAAPGIQAIPQTGIDFTGSFDFSELGSAVAGFNGLLLAPDAVEITFNLNAGEYVDDMTIVGTDFTGPNATTITYAGIDAGGFALVDAQAYGPGAFVSVPALPFAEITSVTITAFETVLSSIEANVEVPEPATASLALAGLALLRRR